MFHKRPYARKAQPAPVKAVEPERKPDVKAEKQVQKETSVTETEALDHLKPTPEEVPAQGKCHCGAPLAEGQPWVCKAHIKAY